jgi:hypothetical protein
MSNERNLQLDLPVMPSVFSLMILSKAALKLLTVHLLLIAMLQGALRALLELVEIITILVMEFILILKYGKLLIK